MSTAAVSPVPFTRLTAVEWRKQLDTRAGRWLLITIGIVTAGVLAIMANVDGGNHSFGGFLVGTSTPMLILLPIVGVLAATAEWSQRTALVTFTLEPRRTRVGVAKLLSAMGSGVAFFAVAVGLAALAHLAVVGFRDADAAWSLQGELVAGMLLLIVIGMAQGVGFGLLLLNTPAAIVTLLVLPTAFGVLGSLEPAMTDVLPWIDLGTAGEPVLLGEPMAGGDWARLATATAIWAGVPLVLGMLRVSRSEVRSA